MFTAHSKMDLPYSQFESTYTIDSFLIQGTTGEFWQVMNKKDGKYYALKISKLPNDEARKNEVMAGKEYLRTLGHDNICHCIHFTVVTKGSEGKYQYVCIREAQQGYNLVKINNTPEHITKINKSFLNIRLSVHGDGTWTKFSCGLAL